MVLSILDIERRIGFLHPMLQQKCKKLLELCEKEGLQVGLFETWRSDERQNHVYNAGASKVNQRGAHGFCVAFDIVVKKNGKWTWDVSDAVVLSTYKRLGVLGQSLGLEWGGSWKNIVDMPHFQYLGGLSLSQYRAGQRPKWWNNWQIGVCREETVMKEVKTLDEALAILVEKKIINTPDYWKKAQEYYKYSKELIIAMANYIVKEG